MGSAQRDAPTDGEERREPGLSGDPVSRASDLGIDAAGADAFLRRARSAPATPGGYRRTLGQPAALDCVLDGRYRHAELAHRAVAHVPQIVHPHLAGVE